MATASLGRLTLDLVARTAGFSEPLSQAERQTRNSARNMSNEFNLVGRSLSDLQGTIFASVAGFLSLGAVISKMDAYTGLQNRLKLVTASQSELNQAMTDTFRVAQATGQAWDSTAQVYQRFADNAKRLGITLSQTASLTDTVAKAISISGGSAASAEAALVQFGQALASGVLRGEEFNSISEQAPGLLKAIATGLDTNIGQLRAMAAEGKLTADVVIKSLEKAKGSVDTLFGKTDFTIGQSFQMLSNEATKFVGEAGKSSGAASVLSESIQYLAVNLENMVTAAQLAGAYYVGSFIPAIYSTVAAGVAKTKQLAEQTITQYGLIQAEKAAAAQSLATAEATLLNTQATLRSLAAEKALELERLKAQINQVGRTASITRMAQLRRIEAQVTAELTVAENALAAARTRAAAASTASLGVGARLLGVLGGPVGLGLTVATLAGSYLLMRDNGLEANAMLNEQSEYAKKSAEDLKSLDNAHKSVAKNELAKKLKDQNDELDRQARLFANGIGDIAQYNNQMGNGAKVSSELYSIQTQVRSGALSLSEALNKVNQIAMITPEQRAQMVNQVEQYNTLFKTVDENVKAQKALGVEVKVSGNAAQNASSQLDGQAKSFNKVEDAARAAKNALENYRSGALTDIKEMSAKTTLLMNSSLSNNQIDYLMMALKSLNYDPKLTGTDEAKQLFNLALQQAKIKGVEDKLIESRKESAKQLEKQIKLQLLNNKELENGYRVYQAFLKAGLSSNQSLAIAAQVGREGDFKSSNIFGYHSDNNNGAKNVGMLSWQGSRAKELLKDLRSKDLLNIDGTIKQTQEAIDVMAKFAVQEIMTKKEYVKTRQAVMSGVEDYSQLSEIFGKNFVRWDFNGKKIDASKHKSKESNYYQQLSQLVGMSSDSSGIKLDDFGADLEKLNQLKQQYEEKYYTDSKKRQIEFDKEINDLKLTYSGKEFEKRIAQSTKQFKAEEDLAKLQFDSQVNGWRWVGEERIKNQAIIDKAVIDASRDLADQQKVIAKANIDEQAKYELGVYKDTIDQQLLSAQSNYMSETEYAIKRYQVELREIEKIRDAKLRAGLLDANRMGQFQSLNQASDNVLQYGQNAAQNYYQNQDPQGFAKWSLQNQYSTEAGGLTGAYNDQVSGINLIQDEEQRNAQLLAAHEQYLQARSALDIKYADDEEKLRAAQLSMNLNYGEQIFGSMTDMLEASGDKQSGIYKAMFAANKAFAIAQSLVSIQQGIAQAAANPFPLNLAAMASVAAATAGIVSNISSVAGVFHGGTDYVPKEASYLLDKGERVLSPRQNSDLTNYLNGRQDTSTGGDIIINNNTSSNVSATRGADGKTYVTIDEVERWFEGSLQNPNSKPSKAMQQNYNAQRRR